MEPWIAGVLGTIVGAVGWAIIRQMWKDLGPRGPVFTWQGIAIFVSLCAVTYPIAVLVRVATGDELVSRYAAQLLLAVFLTIALISAYYGFLFVGLRRRVDAIERHLSSRAASAKPS